MRLTAGQVCRQHAPAVPLRSTRAVAARTVVVTDSDDVCGGDELARLSVLDLRCPEPDYGQQFVAISADILNGRRRAAKHGEA